MKHRSIIDTRRARLHYSNGEVEHFKHQPFAFAVWLALPKGTRVAFRGANDTRPVYLWDYADKP